MRIIIPIIVFVTTCCWLLTSRVEQPSYLPATPQALAAWTRINAAAAMEKDESLAPPTTQPVTLSDAAAIGDNVNKPTTRPAGT